MIQLSKYHIKLQDEMNMCGRFTLFDNEDILEDEFEVDIQPDLFNPFTQKLTKEYVQLCAGDLYPSGQKILRLDTR